MWSRLYRCPRCHLANHTPIHHSHISASTYTKMSIFSRRKSPKTACEPFQPNPAIGYPMAASPGSSPSTSPTAASNSQWQSQKTPMVPARAKGRSGSLEQSAQLPIPAHIALKRARAGSVPAPAHSRMRSHFSIPDLVITGVEEEGQEEHFEVKLADEDRRAELSYQPPPPPPEQPVQELDRKSVV